MCRLRRLARVFGLSLILASMRPVHAADQLRARPQLSPGGRWLVVLLESMRETASTPGDAHRSYRKTGQWLFRLDLEMEKPRPELLERQVGDLSAANALTHADVEIDDEGAVFALRSRAPQLVTWDANLRRAEKRLFGDEMCFVYMHMRPDGKELVVFRQIIGEEDTDRPAEAYRYDLATGEVSRWGALEGLLVREIHWSRDLKHLFAYEAPGKGESEAYTLMRLDLETGERKTMAEGAWLHNTCFSGSWIARKGVRDEHAKKPKRSPAFIKISTSEPFELVEVKGLEDWAPIVAIDEDRVLCRSSDWKKHVVASVTEGKPRSIDLPMPASDRALHHSKALEAFVLIPRGRESECEVRGYDGKLVRKARFDLGAPVKKAK